MLHYSIIEQPGAGGMGIVRECVTLSLFIGPCKVKLVSPDSLPGGSESGQCVHGSLPCL
jgi:hypothetical protein